MIEAQYDALTLEVLSWPFEVFAPALGVFAIATMLLLFLGPELARDRVVRGVLAGLVALGGGLGLWCGWPMYLALGERSSTPWGQLVYGSALWVALLGLPLSMLLGLSAGRIAMSAALTPRRLLLLAGWALPLAAMTPALWVLAVALGETEGPSVRLEVPERVHEGARVEAVVVDAEGWRVAPASQVVPSELGTHTLTAEASRGPLRVVVRAEVEVGRELGTVHLPLRAGHRWSYLPEHDSGAPARFLWERRGQRRVVQDEAGRLSLSLGEPELRGGLRVFPLAVEAAEGLSQDLAIYAFNGEVVLITEDGGHVPALEVTAPSGDALGFATVACRSALFPGMSCRCAARPGGLFKLPPGPLQCTASRGGAMHELLRVTALAASVFAVDIGGSASQRWMLVDHTPGLEDASAVPPQPVAVSHPEVEALAERLAGVTFDHERLALLRRARLVEPLTRDAAAMLVRAFRFDSGRSEAVVLLAPLLENDEQVEVLIDGVMSFAEDKAATRERLRRR